MLSTPTNNLFIFKSSFLLTKYSYKVCKILGGIYINVTLFLIIVLINKFILVKVFSS